MHEQLTHAVGQEPTKPKEQRNQRTAFDIPRRSVVAAAVKPRQAVYKPGPGITVNAEASRRDADKRFGMRWSRI